MSDQSEEDIRAELAERDEKLKSLDLREYDAWAADCAKLIRSEDLDDHERLIIKLHTFISQTLVELSCAIAELCRENPCEKDKILAGGLADLAVLMSERLIKN